MAAGSMSGPKPVITPRGLHPVEPGLHGAARDAEPPRRLEDPDPGLGGQQRDQPRVELVDHKTSAIRGILLSNAD